MEDFPSEYVAANRPLIVFSGFSSHGLGGAPSVEQSGIKISTDLPPVEGQLASTFAAEVLSHDHHPENGRPYGTAQAGSSTFRFHVRTCSREYWLPCRKASPQAVPVDVPQDDQVVNVSTDLHSPLSPLTGSSELHPDGLMTPAWNRKHQRHVPAALVSVFILTSDPSSDTLNDNILKNEVNSITKKLEDSRQRVFHAVVILGHADIADTGDIDERCANIRKGAKLDVKSGLFYISPHHSASEMRSIVNTMFEALKEPCIEHFRDLTRHARRKRDRGNQSPTTSINGLVRPLTQAGWRVRYEFKLGVLAEFRNEYETSERHFTLALDGLLDSGGLLDMMSNWSPRFNQYRLLADVIALHLAKSHLMRSQTSIAVKSWRTFRDRTRNMINKQGKGTDNYGWKAWEARWARSFAQLIDLTPVGELFSERDATVVTKGNNGSPDDRVEMASYLQHPGYWYWSAAKYTIERRRLAAMIPEDDRVPPGQSPATRNARRKELYDDYMCPDPYHEFPLYEPVPKLHLDLIKLSMRDALNAFTAKHQARLETFLQYTLIEEIWQVEGQAIALGPLIQLWSKNHSWRTTGWFTLLRGVGDLLFQAAISANDMEYCVRASWELSHRDINTRLDISSNAMVSDGDSKNNEPARVVLTDKTSMLPLSIDAFFSDAEGHAGEPIGIYLILTSKQSSVQPAMTLSSLRINFDGGVHELSLYHDPDEVLSSQSRDGSALATRTIEIIESSQSTGNRTTYTYRGGADLRILPGQSIVYGMTMVVREPGHLAPLSATVVSRRSDVIIEHEQSLLPTAQNRRTKIRSVPQIRFYKERNAIRILPKLAKIEIYVPNQRPTYFVDEVASLIVEVTNKEQFAAKASLDIRVRGGDDDDAQMELRKQEKHAASGQMRAFERALHFEIGEMLPGSVQQRLLDLKLPSIARDAGLEMELSYRLSDDPETPISKGFTAVIVAVQPFEAITKLQPCLHPDPWDSYFEVLDDNEDQALIAEAERSGDSPTTDTDANSSTGYASRSTWIVKNIIKSTVSDTFTIEKAELMIDKIQGRGSCTSLTSTSTTPVDLSNGVEHDLDFTVELRRPDFVDKSLLAVWSHLALTWRRSDDPDIEPFHSILPISRLTFPTAEPRALAQRVLTGVDDDLIQIDYTLENPSMHFLMFNLTMELNESFAFSGAKSVDLSLIPLSRQTVSYTFTPLVQGAFIRPRLKVVDVFFNRALPVQATSGLQYDQEGICVWVESSEAKE